MDITDLSGIERHRRSRETKFGNDVKKGSVTGNSKSSPSSLSTDTVDISSAGKESRSLLLDSVRARIRSGYYGRDPVAEDVSDKLARLFDR